MRDSIVFYRSFLEATEDLPAEDFKRCVMAILKYGLDGETPTTSGIEKTIFIMAKPQIDVNNKRYENGKKGGRPKTEEKPNDNQTKTKIKPKNNQTLTERQPIVDFSKPNVNVNENANENDNVYGNANGLDTDLLSYQEILAIAKEECPVIHKRHIDKSNKSMNMSTERKVFELLDRLNGIYTYQQLREIFRRASKMYCSDEKYKGCDLVWLLNNLREIEQTKLEEEQPNKKLGFTLCACDIGEVEI